MTAPAEVQSAATESRDYKGAVASWQQNLADAKARTGFDWNWHLEYNLTGYQGRDETEPSVHPWPLDDDTEIAVRDEDHLQELVVAQIESQRPDPAKYMPVWDVPADELGWCLLPDRQRRHPVTPVFATADELIDHLATVGQDWDQVPMRRSAAESLVRSGYSMGSFVRIGGECLDASKDADVIAAKLNGASA